MTVSVLTRLGRARPPALGGRASGSSRTLAANANRSTNTCSDGTRRDLERVLDDVHERRRAAEVEVGVEVVADERAHEVGVHEPLLGVEVVHDLQPIAVLGDADRRARRGRSPTARRGSRTAAARVDRWWPARS